METNKPKTVRPIKKESKKSDALEFDKILIKKYGDFNSYPADEKNAIYIKMKKELGG